MHPKESWDLFPPYHSLQSTSEAVVLYTGHVSHLVIKSYLKNHLCNLGSVSLRFRTQLIQAWSVHNLKPISESCVLLIKIKEIKLKSILVRVKCQPE